MKDPVYLATVKAYVAEVLQRIGWVRKHVGEGERTVRGIVLCEGAPEDLGYAASGGDLACDIGELEAAFLPSGFERLDCTEFGADTAMT